MRRVPDWREGGKGGVYTQGAAPAQRGHGEGRGGQTVCLESRRWQAG